MDKNPYQAPQTNVDTNTASIMEKRPSSPKVIGIIMIVLTVIGIIGMVASLGMLIFGNEQIVSAMLQQGRSKVYLYLTMGLGLIASLFLFYISIQLIKYKDKGRRWFNYYMIYLIIIMPVSFAYQWWVKPEGVATSAILMGLMSSIVGFLIYALFWYLLNREKVKAVLEK